VAGVAGRTYCSSHWHTASTCTRFVSQLSFIQLLLSLVVATRTIVHMQQHHSLHRHYCHHHHQHHNMVIPIILIIYTWAFEFKFSGAAIKVNVSSNEMPLPLLLRRLRNTKAASARATPETRQCFIVQECPGNACGLKK
jgi:hypothetical protein